MLGQPARTWPGEEEPRGNQTLSCQQSRLDGSRGRSLWRKECGETGLGAVPAAAAVGDRDEADPGLGQRRMAQRVRAGVSRPGSATGRVPHAAHPAPCSTRTRPFLGQAPPGELCGPGSWGPREAPRTGDLRRARPARSSRHVHSQAAWPRRDRTGRGSNGLCWRSAAPPDCTQSLCPVFAAGLVMLAHLPSSPLSVSLGSCAPRARTPRSPLAPASWGDPRGPCWCCTCSVGSLEPRGAGSGGPLWWDVWSPTPPAGSAVPSLITATPRGQHAASQKARPSRI